MPKYKTYNVLVVRVRSDWQTVEVDATSKDEALDKALKEAENHDFTLDDDPDYTAYLED